jgi:branched-chain amino acid transport system substrate-binding protein
MSRYTRPKLLIGFLAVGFTGTGLAQESVKIGLNYSKTGPYSKEGLDQERAVNLAVEEMNAQGGILGRKVEIVPMDDEAKGDVSTRNATELIEKHGVKMILGGSSSGVAAAVSKVAKAKGVLFFATQASSTEITVEDGHRYVFRSSTESWMAAKLLSNYLNKNFSGKKYFYISADYNWGHTTEAAFRKFTSTTDEALHKRNRTPFPGAKEEDFKKAIEVATMVKPDVIIFSLFGKDLETAIRLGTLAGLKKSAQFVVPIVTLNMAEGAGPRVFEGVIGQLPWAWNVAFEKNHENGKKYVENFSQKYGRYPDWGGWSAYTILSEYKTAVEKAKTFDAPKVVQALEGREFQVLKDKQIWRAFDHQAIQTVYAVKGRPESEVEKDKFKLNYFSILSTLSGEEASISKEEWKAARKSAQKPLFLEPLFPGEK